MKASRALGRRVVQDENALLATSTRSRTLRRKRAGSRIGELPRGSSTDGALAFTGWAEAVAAAKERHAPLAGAVTRMLNRLAAATFDGWVAARAPPGSSTPARRM